MNYPAHDDHGQASDPHAGHKMADMQGGHDRHARHSVAMFRDKFWLSFAAAAPIAAAISMKERLLMIGMHAAPQVAVRATANGSLTITPGAGAAVAVAAAVDQFHVSYCFLTSRRRSAAHVPTAGAAARTRRLQAGRHRGAAEFRAADRRVRNRRLRKPH